jgi:hypothetical protein
VIPQLYTQLWSNALIISLGDLEAVTRGKQNAIIIAAQNSSQQAENITTQPENAVGLFILIPKAVGAWFQRGFGVWALEFL